MASSRRLRVCVAIAWALASLGGCRASASDNVRQFCDETHVGDPLEVRLEAARGRGLTLRDHRASTGTYMVKSESPNVAYCEISVRGTTVDRKHFFAEAW
jgi:hypothetical protein